MMHRGMKIDFYLRSEYGMKRLLMVFLMLMFVGNVACAEPKASVELHRNFRFGFGILIPVDAFVLTSDLANGDGFIFSNANGSMRVVVSGAHNVLEETTDSEAQRLLRENPGVQIKVKNKKMLLAFWRKGELFYWQKVIIPQQNKDDDRILTLFISYNNSMKEEELAPLHQVILPSFEAYSYESCTQM